MTCCMGFQKTATRVIAQEGRWLFTLFEKCLISIFPLKNDFCSVNKYLNFSAKNGPKIYIKIGYFCAEIQSIQIEQLKQF